jgi:hypothetical protein
MSRWKGIHALLSAAMMLSPSARGEALSARLQKICNYKENVEYRGRAAKCVASYDSGLTAASASYQPALVGPNTATPEAVNRYMYNGKAVYRNDYPSIKGTRDGIDQPYNYGPYNPTSDDKIEKQLQNLGSNPDKCSELLPNKMSLIRPKLNADKERIEKGKPLAFRFLDVIDRRFNHGNAAKRDDGKPVSESDVPLYTWLDQKWLPTQQANLEATSSSDGSCFMWAPWSVDRKVLKSLQSLQSGLMCEGIPLTLGEIKEIYFQLYAAVARKRPYIREEALAFFPGNENQVDPFGDSEVKKAMDANLGLSRLGALGGGLTAGQQALDPDRVLDKFREAMEANPPKSFTFDRDHGAQMWNQPVVAMVVTRYRGDAAAADLLTTTDYSPVGGDTGLRDLQDLESSLILRLSGGKGLDPSDRQRLERMAGRALREGASLEEQARLVTEAKSKLLSAGKIAPKGGNGALQVILQDLTIVYGEENTYSSMEPDHESTRSFRFATVVDGNGRKVKSTWNPTQGKLSELCKSEKPEFTGFSSWNGAYECCKLATGQLKEDYPVFTSAVPPRHVDIFDPIEPDLNDPAGEAYLQFQALLMGEAAFSDPAQKAEAIRRWGPLKAACPSFDRAARFSKLFEECRRKGVISGDERTELLDLFDQAEFLDDQWVQNNLCATAGLPDSFAELKSVMVGKRPGICR